MVDMSVTAPARGITIAERRRVVAATTVGTAIEWYDYFLYAAAAGLVFRTVVFAPLGPAAATVVSFLTVGLSFLVRPFGALLAGHYGDRIGRRTVLMVTLLCMGASTTLIGLLPTYASIGVWSPVLLIVLRVLQGVSAGGEWGGAVLMSVEHAPVDRRGLYGSGPQVGVPIGLLMASGALGLVSVIAPGDAFTAWGWRIPFLVSAVLVVVGYLVRHGVEESPVFTEIVERGAAASAPVGVLLRGHLPVVVVAALVFAGNGAVGYMTTGGYIQSYATDPAGPLRLDRTGVLLIVSASAVVWGVSTLLAGWLSDKAGRRTTYLLGFALQFLGVLALFPLVDTGNLGLLAVALAGLSVGLGFTYGQQSAMYAELFPANLRFSGVSVTYALGAILGGAFSPTVATLLRNATGGTGAITVYLGAMTVVGFIAAFVLRDRTGVPLGQDDATTLPRFRGLR